MLPYVAAVDHDGLLSILDQQAEAQADGKVHPAFADHDVDNVEDAHEQNDSILDAAMLLQLYAALVEAARAAMLHYSTVSSATVGTAQQAAVDVLKQHRATCRHSPTSKDLRPVYDAAHSLVFDLWSYDHTTSLSQHTSHGDRRVKVLRVELPRIPSAVHSGKLLGSLIYADSFIDLPRAGKSDRRELLVLTDAVPPLLTWSSSGAEEKEAAMSIAHLQRVMKAATSVAWQSEVGMLGMGVPVVGEEAIAGARHSRRSSTTHRRRSSTSGSAVGSWVLGWPLLDEGEHVRLCVPCDVLQVVYGTWYTFEHGLVFVSPRMGPFILDFGSNCVSSAALHYEDQDHIPVAIVFETSAQAISPFGPFHSLVANTTMPVQLTFDMSTLAPPARRHFVREVLPAWQDMWRQCHVRYYPEADLPLPLALTTANLEGKVYPVMVPDELVAAFLAGMDSEDAIQRCMDLRRPPQGLSPSIPCRGISATPRGRRMIPITLVCGLPGSGKMSLCTHLVKFLGNSRRWFVIRNNLQEGPRKLSEEKIQRSLGEVLRATGSYFRVGSSRTLNLAGDGDMDENDIRSSPNDSSVISPTSSQHSTPYSSFSDLSKAGEVSQDTTAMPHVLLVCPGLIPLSQMVEAVNSCNHVMDGRCGIVSVTACVSAGMLFENSEQVKALPGIAENLVAGLIDNVVLFDTQGIPHTHLNAIHAFIRNRNPIARLFDVSRGNLGEMLESVVKGIECSEEEGAPSLEEGEADVRRFLGTDDNASPLSLVMARRLAAPPKPSLPIPGSVDCVYLRCVGELDQEELRRSLTEVLLGRAETPSSPRKSHKGPLRVHHVKGYFRQEPGAPLMRVAAVRGRALSFAPTESLVVLPVVSDSRNNDALFGRLDIAIHTHLDKDVAGGEFLFVGTSPLSRSILERALEDSQPVIAPLRVEKCPETLTPHDIASIEREHRDEPLPSGWFYDGARYVDHEGSAQQRHPNFDLWAAQSVASQNVKIRAENEYIRKKRAMLTPLKFL